MPNRPMVYFIGAGPGDPGLLTLRGAACLGRADVVVYDRLVHTAVLRHARPGAERIDVGRAAPQGTDRDAIAYLLVEKVREGKKVARLKWGDPFIFDDGGEEALFLHEHGIPFDVVPGVPAAVGTPPYAGVAVTYRGGGDTLTLVRGHEDASGKLPKVDWTSLARLGGTIVCYAGPSQLPAMLSALKRPRAAGRRARGAHLQRDVGDAADHRGHARVARRGGAAGRSPSGHRRRGTRGRAARASALVRREAAVRPPGGCHAPAGAGARTRRTARRPGRAGDSRAHGAPGARGRLQRSRCRLRRHLAVRLGRAAETERCRGVPAAHVRRRGSTSGT